MGRRHKIGWHRQRDEADRRPGDGWRQRSIASRDHGCAGLAPGRVEREPHRTPQAAEQGVVFGDVGEPRVGTRARAQERGARHLRNANGHPRVDAPDAPHRNPVPEVIGPAEDGPERERPARRRPARVAAGRELLPGERQRPRQAAPIRRAGKSCASGSDHERHPGPPGGEHRDPRVDRPGLNDVRRQLPALAPIRAGRLVDHAAADP